MIDTPINPNKALWENGDFTCIAETMRESGEELVQRIGIGNEHKVLDLGCGDGTTALPAAKLGADVRGSTLRNLVALGSKRAADHRLANCKAGRPSPEMQAKWEEANLALIRAAGMLDDTRQQNEDLASELSGDTYAILETAAEYLARRGSESKEGSSRVGEVLSNLLIVLSRFARR